MYMHIQCHNIMSVHTMLSVCMSTSYLPNFVFFLVAGECRAVVEVAILLEVCCCDDTVSLS